MTTKTNTKTNTKTKTDTDTKTEASTNAANYLLISPRIHRKISSMGR